MKKYKESLLSNRLLQSLRSVIKSKKVGLHEPYLGENEKRYLKKCIESGYVSYLGEYVLSLEKKITDYTGAKYAVTTNSGTSALHLACRLLEINNNCEVLMPALSFVAPANAVSYMNGTPHFVDIENETFGIDPQKLRNYLSNTTYLTNLGCINKRTKKVIKAIIVIHAYGHPAQIQKIIRIANEFKIKVIEDAAESLGSFYNNKHTGLFGDIGVLSFNGNKVITTGGGGALLTKNKKIYENAKHLSTTAKIKHKWEYIHNEVGYNYRMPNINAAVGCSQFERISKLLKYKRRLARKYEIIFEDFDEVRFMKERKNSISNYWLNTIIIEKNFKSIRDDLLQKLHKNGYQARPLWEPLNKLKMFKACPKDNLAVTNDIVSRTINLPSGYNII